MSADERRRLLERQAARGDDLAQAQLAEETRRTTGEVPWERWTITSAAEKRSQTTRKFYVLITAETDAGEARAHVIPALENTTYSQQALDDLWALANAVGVAGDALMVSFTPLVFQRVMTRAVQVRSDRYAKNVGFSALSSGTPLSEGWYTKREWRSVGPQLGLGEWVDYMTPPPRAT